MEISDKVTITMNRDEFEVYQHALRNLPSDTETLEKIPEAIYMLRNAFLPPGEVELLVQTATNPDLVASTVSPTGQLLSLSTRVQIGCARSAWLKSEEGRTGKIIEINMKRKGRGWPWIKVQLDEEFGRLYFHPDELDLCHS